MLLPKLNPIEPPWYGPVCPVVWEGWHREVSPYPDPWCTAVTLEPELQGHLSHRQRTHLARGAAPSRDNSVRPDGAEHQWRKVPPGELSVSSGS
jgi:hypothetical protein